jgi:soluble lytic murein transglycosylase-like protein
MEFTSIKFPSVGLLRLLAGCIVAVSLGACSLESMMATPRGAATTVMQPESDAAMAGAGMNAQIGRYAALYKVPESLIRRIIVRESGYNASAHHGPYWGLMQIRYDTARSMGYRGSAAGLLDADTNLRYGVKYLSGAYTVAYGDPEKAVSYYASGYFYDAQRRGLLEQVGLKRQK